MYINVHVDDGEALENLTDQQIRDEFKERGMGKYRWYICPKGLIKVEELPTHWGLLYVGDKGTVKQIKAATEFPEYSRDNEFMMLTSALGAPWKLFQHWSTATLQRLVGVNWMAESMKADVAAFCARIAANRVEEDETDIHI